MRRRSLFVALSAVALGCSLLVDADPEPIGCSAAGSVGEPACAEGFVCSAGACVACGARERCANRIDDDCNGRVDDGCVGAAGAAAER